MVNALYSVRGLCSLPARFLSNAGLMLGQRGRRWPSISPTLDEHLSIMLDAMHHYMWSRGSRVPLPLWQRKFLSRSLVKIQYCGEHPWSRGSVLGLRVPGIEFRILCLEGSALWFISPSSYRSHLVYRVELTLLAQFSICVSCRTNTDQCASLWQQRVVSPNHKVIREFTRPLSDRKRQSPSVPCRVILSEAVDWCVCFTRKISTWRWLRAISTPRSEKCP